MTKRAFLLEAREFFPEGSEQREVADKMLAQLDKKSTKPTKAQLENEGYKAEIAEVLGDEPQTAREIAERVGLSTNKVAALLKQIDGVEKVAGAKAKDAPRYKRGQPLKVPPPTTRQGDNMRVVVQEKGRTILDTLRHRTKQRR